MPVIPFPRKPVKNSSKSTLRRRDLATSCPRFQPTYRGANSELPLSGSVLFSAGKREVTWFSVETNPTPAR